jgi:hypothetical protein
MPLPPASTAQGATEFIVNASLLAAFFALLMADLNHLANSAQAVPALARKRGRSSHEPPERYAARCGASRALPLPRRGEGDPLGGGRAPPAQRRARQRHEPRWVGGGTHVSFARSALTRTLAGGATRGHTNFGCQARLAR